MPISERIAPEIPVNCSGFGDFDVFQSSGIVVTGGEGGQLMLTDPKKPDENDEKRRVLVMDGMIGTLSISPDEKFIILSSDCDNNVCQYHAETFQLDKIIFRSTVPVKHVSISPKYLVVAADEPKTHIIERESNSIYGVLQGHSGSLKSVAISPNEDYIASSSTDGEIKVFSTEDQKELISLPLIASTHRYDDDMLCRMAWSPQQMYLALPGSKEIELRDAADPKFPLLKRLIKHEDPVSVVSWSPNGEYLASGCLGNQIFIWDVAKESCIARYSIEYIILGLKWSPIHNALAIFHVGGQFLYDENVVPNAGKERQLLPALATTTAPTQANSEVPPSTDDTITKKSAAIETSQSVEMGSGMKEPDVTEQVKPTSSKFVLDEADVDDTLDSDDDEDDDEDLDMEEDGSGLVQVEEDSKEVTAAENNEDPSKQSSLNQIKATFGFNEDNTQLRDFDEDDMADDSDDDLDAPNPDPNNPGASSSAILNASTLSFLTKKNQQTPFQSGSVNENGINLLAWTPYGEIESVSRSASMSKDDDDDYKLIRIDFADKSRRSVKFNDQFHFVMAAFDRNGAVFASRRVVDEDDISEDDPDQLPSFVLYKAFSLGKQTQTNSWHAPLSMTEDAVAVACGSTWCAVATTAKQVRVYSTLSGLLETVFHYSSSVLTLAGSDTFLMVVTASSSPVGPSSLQCESIYIPLGLKGITFMCKADLPLSTSQATLKWIGYNEKNVLFAVDSNGLTQAFNYQSNHWHPLVQKKQILHRDSFENSSIWPLGFVNDKFLYFQLQPNQNVPNLRGKQRPIPSSFSLSSLNHINSNEELKWSRLSLQQQQYLMYYKKKQQCFHQEMQQYALSSSVITAQHVQVDRVLLTQIKEACMNDNDARAQDLVRELGLEKSLSIALRIAGTYRLSEVENFIRELQEERFPLDAAIDDEYLGAPSVSKSDISYSQAQMQNSKHVPQSPPSSSSRTMKAPTSEQTMNTIASEEEDIDHSSRSSSLKGMSSPSLMLSQTSIARNPFAVKSTTSIAQKRKSVPQLLEALRSPLKKQSTSSRS